MAVGATFHGDVDTHVKESPENGFVLRLMCVRRVVTGSGRNRSTDEKVLSADEQRVSASAAMRNPLGTRIPFTFTVPGDAQPSDERVSSDMIVWRLAVTAEVPGINYASDFQFPVFASGEQPHAPIEFAVATVSATAWVPSPESRIVLTPLRKAAMRFASIRAPGERIARPFAVHDNLVGRGHLARLDQDGNARGDLQVTVTLQVVDEPDADTVVLTLDGGNFGAESVLEGLGFVRQNLHGRLVCQEIFEVIEDEDSNALFRIVDTIETGLQALDDRRERMLLDKVEKALFRLEVIIKPGERHAAFAREVTHGSSFVPLLAEDFGRMR